MSSRDAVIRQVAFWAALLAGAALVGSQFGCDRPQTTPSSAGFPHAGRWPIQQEHTPPGALIAETDRVDWWFQPERSEQPITRAQIHQTTLERHHATGRAEAIPEGPKAIEEPVLIAAVAGTR